LPGLTGSCNDNYIQRIAGALYELDYKVIVYHPRFNGSRLVLPTEGYLNILDDFKETMKIVHDNYKGHKLLGIGHSYGANLLVRYLGLVEDHSFIGAVSLANPCNFLLSESKLRGKLIDKALLKLLQKAA
jgi:predicted alpha/beta-fold hydrolase